MLNDDSKGAWDRLALFLSRDVLERRYQARHDRELNAGKAKEIISHLDQARQYFTSAESAGVLAGPLEQYYGVLAFARAIVLYRNPCIRESGLQKKHGLRATLAGDVKIEDIQLKVERGTFDELLNSTSNVSLAAYEELVNGMIPVQQRIARSWPRPLTEATFSLTNLLSRIPDLRQHYEEAFDSPAHCYAGGVSLLMGSLTVNVWRERFDLPPLEELKASLGIAWANAGAVTPLKGAQFQLQLKGGDSLTGLLPNSVRSHSNGRTLVELFPGGWSLSELASYFAASHVLGMLVRYYPSRWAHLVSREKGDRVLPVLDRMRGLIQTEFVRLALREIDREPE